MRRWTVTITVKAAAMQAFSLFPSATFAVIAILAHLCNGVITMWKLEQRCCFLQLEIPSHTGSSSFDAWKQIYDPEVCEQHSRSFLLHPGVVSHGNRAKSLHRKHLRGGHLLFNIALLACIPVQGAVQGAIQGMHGNSNQNCVDECTPVDRAVPSRSVGSVSLPEAKVTSKKTGARSLHISPISSLEDISRDIHSRLSNIGTLTQQDWALRSTQVDAGERRTYHTNDPEAVKSKSHRTSAAADRRYNLLTVEDDGTLGHLLERPISHLVPTLDHRRHLMSLGRKHNWHALDRTDNMKLHLVKHFPNFQLLVAIVVVTSLLGLFFYITRKRLPDGSSKLVLASCVACLTREPATTIPSCHPGADRSVPWVPYGSLRRFQFKELDQATKKFSAKIGSGGYGEVFKGSIENGQLIAVKRGIPAASDTDGMMEIMKEIEILSALRHRHLVKLLGYCSVGNPCKNVILVYEYVPNGTLADHLYGDLCKSAVLSWADRLRIARDAARAIAYLHSGTTGQVSRRKTKISVIHRDIKPSNILLDDKLRAKVGDFGISTVVPNNEKTHITTGVKGTVGYLDPLYHVSHQLTRKSDVYSFGIVLLELVSGRRAVDLTKAEQDWQVLPWLHTTYPAQGSEAVTDPRLERGTYSRKSVNKIIDCAILCCQPYSRNRPDMCGVLQMIDEAIRIETTEGYDENFDTASSVTNPSLTSTPKRSSASLLSPLTVDRPIHVPY